MITLFFFLSKLRPHFLPFFNFFLLAEAEKYFANPAPSNTNVRKSRIDSTLPDPKVRLVMILTLKLWYEAEWPRFLQKVSFWFFLWFLFVLILKTLKARAPATCGPFNFQNHSRRLRLCSIQKSKRQQNK